MPNDVVLDVFLCPTHAVDEMVATTHRAVGVHHHVVGTLHVERRSVGHADDADALAHGLFVGHLIDDARARVEVVNRVFHLVCIFEIVFHLLARQGHDCQRVFERIPSEEIFDEQLTGLEGLAAAQRGCHRDVGVYAFGFDDIELAAMDFIDPEARAFEGVVGENIDGQFGHDLPLVFASAVKIWLEHGEEFGVFLFAVGGHYFDADLWLVAFLQLHFGLGQALRPVARIEHTHGVARHIHPFFSLGAVVVAVEDEVKSRHVFGYPFRGIFASQRVVGWQVLRHGFPSRVEKPHHQVGMLLLADVFHPFFGGGLQLLETQPWAQAVGHPSDDVGCQQA